CPRILAGQNRARVLLQNSRVTYIDYDHSIDAFRCKALSNLCICVCTGRGKYEKRVLRDYAALPRLLTNAGLDVRNERGRSCNVGDDVAYPVCWEFAIRVPLHRGC